MKLKFQHIKDTSLDIDYGMMLVMEDKEIIQDFCKRQMRELPTSLKNIKEDRNIYDDGIARGLGIKIRSFNSHLVPELADVLCKASGTVFVVQLMLNKLDALEKYGKLYLNKKGGYMSRRDSLEILEEKVIEFDPQSPLNDYFQYRDRGKILKEFLGL